jgi:cell wall-associated NlpC family hydrolase
MRDSILYAQKSRVVKVAREYLGTRWVHQGRIKGKSIDCLGLLVCVAREFGAKVLKDRTDYDFTNIDTEAMRKVLEFYMKTIPERESRPGDVVLFKIAGSPQHLGILTGKGMVHANMKTRFVREDSIGMNLRKNIVSFFDFRPWEWVGRENG